MSAEENEAMIQKWIRWAGNNPNKAITYIFIVIALFALLVPPGGGGGGGCGGGNSGGAASASHDSKGDVGNDGGVVIDSAN